MPPKWPSSEHNSHTFHSNPPCNHTSYQPFSFNMYGLKALSFATLLLASQVFASRVNYSMKYTGGGIEGSAAERVCRCLVPTLANKFEAAHNLQDGKSRRTHCSFSSMYGVLSFGSLRLGDYQQSSMYMYIYYHSCREYVIFIFSPNQRIAHGTYSNCSRHVAVLDDIVAFIISICQLLKYSQTMREG